MLRVLYILSLLLLQSHELFILSLVLINLLGLVGKSRLNLLVKLLGIGWGRRLDGYFVVEVSVVVTHFFLIIGAAPLPIDNILVLILARGQRMQQAELVVGPWHPLHLGALLPVAEGTYYEDFMAAMAPHKNVLDRSLAMSCQRELNLLLDLSMLLLSL